MYLEFFKKSFQQCVVYRVNTTVRFFSSFIYLFVTVSIWSALYRGRESVEGIVFLEMLTYVLMVQIVRAVNMHGVSDYFARRVVDGNVSVDFIRPVNTKLCAVADTAGESAFSLVTSALPMTILGAFIWGFKLPGQLWQYPVFLISLLLGTTVYILMQYIMGLWVFWTKTGFHIEWTIGALFTLFSGAQVPLWFYPYWLRSIADYLPFKYIVFEPINIFLGRYTQAEAMSIIMLQIIWAAVFYAVGRFVWRYAQRIITVQGG